MDFALPDEIAELERSLLRFAEAEMRPRARAAEAKGAWDPHVVRVLDGFGIPSLDIPEEIGGLGAGVLAKVVALEAAAFGDAGGLPAFDVGPAAAAIVACPDAELAREVVRETSAHEVSAHLAVLPADQDMERAVRLEWAPGSAPSRWLFVTQGNVLTAYDMGEAPVQDAEAAAFHASSGVTLVQRGGLEEARWVLEDEGALALRGRARLWPAAVAVGVARAALGYASTYARERMVAGRPVAHHQSNAFAIAEAAARLDAARLTVRAAASQLDDRRRGAGAWATLAYLETCDSAPWICDLGVQLLGGHGYIEDHPVEKWFREARMLTLLWGGRGAALADAPRLVDAPDPLAQP